MPDVACKTVTVTSNDGYIIKVANFVAKSVSKESINLDFSWWRNLGHRWLVFVLTLRTIKERSIRNKVIYLPSREPNKPEEQRAKNNIYLSYEHMWCLIENLCEVREDIRWIFTHFLLFELLQFQLYVEGNDRQFLFAM